MLEPLEAALLTEPVERRLLDVLAVGHAQLVEHHGLLPTFEHPHARAKQLAGLVHVTQVRRAERQVPVEFFLVFFKVRQGSPNNQTAQAVSDKSKAAQLRSRARLPNILMHFVRQFLTHVKYVVVRVLLVGLGAEEQGVGQRDRDDVFEHAHVEG